MFESWQGNTHTADEDERTLVGCALDSIRRYSIAQFRHRTEDGFSSRFRKMLTIEQYNDSTMADLYQNYLAAGPAEYMARIFRRAASTDAEAKRDDENFFYVGCWEYKGDDETATSSSIPMQQLTETRF